MRKISIFLAIFCAILYGVVGDYANYVRRGNKLEIVMEPVSSTIEPVSIYKPSPRNHRSYDDGFKYDKNILLTVLTAIAISCNDILREGSVKEFSKDDLATLSSSTPQQLETCLFILGKNEIDKSRSQTLWETIKTVYGSVSDVPEENLKQLGWVISGIPVADFSNVSVTDIDTVTILGLYRNLSAHQLIALKQTIDNQWSRKVPEQLTGIDLIALRQILCAFNDSELLSIHPDSYRDAAGELATLKNCPKSALTQLVTLAKDEDAFGRPSKWSSIQVASIGCVMAGLSNVNDIPAESMEGITPDIIECLPPSFFQKMTSKQLQHLTTNAASSISAAQIETLSSNQKDAVDLAITGLKYTKPSSSSSATFSGIRNVRTKANRTLTSFPRTIRVCLQITV